MTVAVGTLNRPRVLADVLPGSLSRDATLVILGDGAQIAIPTPLSPVPFTLQTLAVLVVGAALGSGRGGIAVLTYAVAGVAFVPWFAGHAAGWGGPNFGYVIGLVVERSSGR